MYTCKFYPSQEKLVEIVKAQTEIIKSGFDITNVMFLVVNKAMELTGSNGAVIELATDEDMVYTASCGSLENYLGLRLKIDGSLSGMCIQTNQLLYSKESQSDPRVDTNAVKRLNINSMVVMPLKHEENTVGVLKVVSDKKEFFNETDLCTMSLMAEMMAATMFYANKFSTDELYKKATRDTLTGLYNRGAFYDFFRQYINKAQTENKKFAILVMDMDGLKPINDTYGHQIGDKVLIEFANRIKNCTTNGIVSRIGGDEFYILLNNIKENTIEDYINHIDCCMKHPLRLEKYEVSFGASVGYSVYPDCNEDIHTLIEKADSMMYENKKKKKLSR
jgi:diguanylate cyclase (GGDEF)-like protein